MRLTRERGCKKLKNTVSEFGFPEEKGLPTCIDNKIKRLGSLNTKHKINSTHKMLICAIIVGFSSG